MKKAGIILTFCAVISLGNAVTAAQDYTKTSDTFNLQVQQTMSTSFAYANRASMKFFRDHDTEGALQDFDNAISIEPDNCELYLNRGYIRQLSGDLSGALEDYNSSLRIRPNYAYAYNNRAVLRVAMQDIAGAMDDYTNAINSNPKYSDAYYNRANLKYMLNDNKGALEDYDKAIELNPKDSDAYNNRGVVKKRMNYNVGALSDYSQAIALNPSDSIAYANRGRLKKLYFDNEGASIDLDQAVALAENQTFIKNVKPLLSTEQYVAAIPTEKQHVVVTKNAQGNAVLTKTKPQQRLAYYYPLDKDMISGSEFEATGKPDDMLEDNEKLKKDAIEAKNAAEKETAKSAAATQKQSQVKTVSNKTKSTAKQQANTKPAVQKKNIAYANGVPVPMSSDIGKDYKPNKPVAVAQKKNDSKNTNNASSNQTSAKAVDNKQAVASAPSGSKVQTPAAVYSSQTPTEPTTNTKLAESYYIRGLQKCVLRDLKGAKSDLDKAISNNSEYAEAYFYRAAIKKELGDIEGFRADYGNAIKLKPSLQQFNQENALALINQL